MSGGDTDQFHPGDSLRGPNTSDHQHILPSMDCLAHLLWTLEPDHDCFPLLQGYQDIPWVSPNSKITSLLFCRTTIWPDHNLCNKKNVFFFFRKKMTLHLFRSAKNASCPNQQEHTTVVSVTGESVSFTSLNSGPPEGRRG